jgi:hypothetical protein
MQRPDVRRTVRPKGCLRCGHAASAGVFLVLVMTAALPCSVSGQTRKARAEKTAKAEKGTQPATLKYYPDIQGIHFDEQSSHAKDVDYYAELYRYVRKRIPEAIVLNNPGTVCAADYVARPAADVVCLFERDRAFEEFRPPAWATRFPASRFCVQSHKVDTEAEMKRALRRAVQLRVGYIYITDDVGPNPYDRLPTYWDAEVEAVRQANQPTAR